METAVNDRDLDQLTHHMADDIIINMTYLDLPDTPKISLTKKDYINLVKATWSQFKTLILKRTHHEVIVAADGQSARAISVTRSTGVLASNEEVRLAKARQVSQIILKNGKIVVTQMDSFASSR